MSNMRSFLVLAILTIGCSPTEKKNTLFAHHANNETVVIYLSNYGLDSVPEEIGELKKVKNLYITQDSAAGWTIYPPLSALQPTPPFRHLPDAITKLSALKNLSLVGLNLKTLPTDFGDLQQLDSLNLMLNKLTISNELEKLKKLKNLKYAVLTGNQVDTADINSLRKEKPDLIVKSGFEVAETIFILYDSDHHLVDKITNETFNTLIGKNNATISPAQKSINSEILIYTIINSA